MGTYFCGSRKKTAKIAKIRTRKNLVPQGNPVLCVHCITADLVLTIFNLQKNHKSSPHRSVFVALLLVECTVFFSVFSPCCLISTGPVCCFNRIFRLKPFVSILFCLDVRCNDVIQRLNFSAFLKLL